MSGKREGGESWGEGGMSGKREGGESWGEGCVVRGKEGRVGERDVW